MRARSPGIENRHPVRLDIILILLLGGTAFLALGLWRKYSSNAMPVGAPELFLNAILIYAALCFEVTNLIGRERNTSANDLGVISAVVSVLSVAGLPVMAATFLPGLNTRSAFAYWAGVMVFILGITLRAIASRSLGSMFDHAIRIQEHHVLVKTGIYKTIRHPAYLGTLLMAGASFGLWQTSVQLIVTAVFIALTVLRIRREERMLRGAFGRQYDLYQRHSWRLLPFVY